MEQYRQGDLLLTKISKPRSAKPAEQDVENGRLVLLRGERTGHAHTVEADKATIMSWGDVMALEVAEETELTHDEHNPIPLKPGTYQVNTQRRFNYDDLPRPQRQAMFD